MILDVPCEMDLKHVYAIEFQDCEGIQHFFGVQGAQRLCVRIRELVDLCSTMLYLTILKSRREGSSIPQVAGIHIRSSRRQNPAGLDVV